MAWEPSGTKPYKASLDHKELKHAWVITTTVNECIKDYNLVGPTLSFPKFKIDKQGQPVSPSQLLSHKDQGPILNSLRPSDAYMRR